uniref:Uncharacterized protein n=1 Tax=Anguilla anguilla TaxID=7936 RepID=A0A0E9T548_ANGAN
MDSVCLNASKSCNRAEYGGMMSLP